jgi:hypothetical protein
VLFVSAFVRQSAPVAGPLHPKESSQAPSNEKAAKKQ